jgi:hypothetical protein
MLPHLQEAMTLGLLLGWYAGFFASAFEHALRCVANLLLAPSALNGVIFD